MMLIDILANAPSLINQPWKATPRPTSSSQIQHNAAEMTPIPSPPRWLALKKIAKPATIENEITTAKTANSSCSADLTSRSITSARSNRNEAKDPTASAIAWITAHAPKSWGV